jgi:tetratricopeptide (TPR) repeat protein
VASGGLDGLAQIWRVDDGLPMATVRSHFARAHTAFYSQDGDDLVTTSDDHTALHWKSGQLQPFGPALKHKGDVECAVFNKDASIILTCDDTGIAQLWDAKTGQPQGAPYQHHDPVSWVDFHPDAQHFLAVSGSSVFVWSVSDQTKPLAVLTAHGDSGSKLNCARFSPDGKWIVTGATNGDVRVWDAQTYQPTAAAIHRDGAVLCVRFSQDGTLLAVTGEDSQAAIYDTKTWQTVGVPVIAPGPVFSAIITPDDRFIAITAYLTNAVQFFDIKTGAPLGEGAPLFAQPTSIDYMVKDRVVVAACDDGTVRAVGSPFVGQDVPAWMCDFAEGLGGYRQTGPYQFERAGTTYSALSKFLTPEVQASNLDFSRLARWRLRFDDQKPGMPRFTSTLAANIENRVDQRSVSDLFECYDALPGDPLVLGALSLFWPNLRHGEYLADVVLAAPASPPLARCYAAETLINAGRSQEAKAAIARAVADAPNDYRVLRRAAKVAARMSDVDHSIAFFDKALQLNPGDYETMRSYGWALYEFHRPQLAAQQFQHAEDIVGDMDNDLIAGLCLSAKMSGDDAQARTDFTRMAAFEPDWKKMSYITSLRGWTEIELAQLETVCGELYGTTH